MKTVAVLCNAVLFAFTGFVLATDGAPARQVDPSASRGIAVAGRRPARERGQEPPCRGAFFEYRRML